MICDIDKTLPVPLMYLDWVRIYHPEMVDIKDTEKDALIREFSVWCKENSINVNGLDLAIMRGQL